MSSRRQDRWRHLPAAALLFLVVSSAIFKISTFDVWWHLAYGKLIFETGEIPRTDVFSFTAAGAERTDHEWGFQVLVYALHRLGGGVALILAKALWLALIAILVHRFVRRETGLSPAGAALALVPFILAGHNRFVLRPDVLSLGLSVVLAGALFRRRASSLTLKDLGWVPLVFALWANLHGGLIVGVVLLALFIAGRVVELFLARLRGSPVVADGRPALPTLLGLLPLSLAGGLVNPFFHRVYGVPFHITSLHESGIFRNLEWQPPQWPAHWLFFLTVAVSGVVAAARWRSPDWPALLNLAFVAFIALRYVRNLAFFGFLAPIFLAAMIAVRPVQDEAAPDRRDRLSRLLPAPLAVAVLVLLGLSFLAGNPRFANGLGVDDRRLPVAAVDFLETSKPPGRLLNAHAFGGYAIWRLYPETRVFIDGRDDIFASLRARLGRAVVDSRRWTELLDEYQIGHTLLQYIDRLEEVRIPGPAGGAPETTRRPYAVNHFPPRAWALVYFDDVAMVHVRRTAEAAPLIERYGYSHVFPEDPRFQLEAIALGWAERGGAIRELKAKIEDDPSCLRARRLLEAIVTGGVGRSDVRPAARAAAVVHALDDLRRHVAGGIAFEGAVDADGALEMGGDQVHVVADHDDRHAGVEPFQQLEDLALAMQVDALGRLVEQQQFGLGGERAGDQHPLALAARELGDRAFGEVEGAGERQGVLGGGDVGAAEGRAPG